MQQQQLNPLNKWVTLYLVPQTEVSAMPESVTGIFVAETTGVYVLGCMLEEVEDETGGWVTRPSEGLNLIHKPYVWRLEVLASKPDIVGWSEYRNDDGGGLG